MLKKLFGNKLVLVLVVASFLRLFLLDRIPPSLNWDEVSMGYTAYSISKTGSDEWGKHLPLLFRSYGEWKSAVYIYLLVPFINIFGLNAWGVRLPSALAGILAVYLTYLIGRRLYSPRVGLWAAFFLALSPWHLVLSRPAFEANVSLTLILAGVYFFLANRLLMSAVMFGLAPHTYNSAKVVVPLLIFYLLWQSKLYKKTKELLLFVLPLALFALPLLLNLFTGRSAHRFSQVGITTDIKALAEFVHYRQDPAIPPLLGKVIFNRYTYSLHEVARNYLTYLSPSFLLVEAGDHTQHHVPYFGVLYLPVFILFLLGLTELKNAKGDYKYLPLVIIALGILPASLTRDEGHVLRSILTLPGWQLVAGLGAVHLYSRKQTKPLLILSSIFVVQLAVFLAAYFWWYPRTFARDWQYGYKEVAAYLIAHEREYDHIVMTKWFGEPQLFLAFYNQWDPVWFQSQNLVNLSYESQGKLWLDQLDSYSLGKYSFEYLDLAKKPMTPRTLYIGKFDDFPGISDFDKTIHYPDGSVAFYLVRGQ